MTINTADMKLHWPDSLNGIIFDGLPSSTYYAMREAFMSNEIAMVVDATVRVISRRSVFNDEGKAISQTQGRVIFKFEWSGCLFSAQFIRTFKDGVLFSDRLRSITLEEWCNV